MANTVRKSYQPCKGSKRYKKERFPTLISLAALLAAAGDSGSGIPSFADPNRTLCIAYPRGAAVLSFAACTRDASGKICDWESAIRIG